MDKSFLESFTSGFSEAVQALPLAAMNSILVNLLQSLFLVLIGLILSLAARRIVRKFFLMPKHDQGSKSLTISLVLQNFIKYSIWILIVCQVLMVFGVSQNTILSLTGIGSVAIGFGSQTIVKDVITGLFILLENQYNIGDVVTINGHSGVVESLGIRTTKIRSANGDVHIFPNSSIGAVTNMSKEFKRATINLEFTSACGVDHVLDVLTEEMDSSKGLKGLITPPEVLGLIELSPSAFKVQIQAQCESVECWPIERELRLRIKRRFEKEGIK
ncbi:MAG: mechanosensitive ion channel family protein [Clostridiales bacterium]|jgi:small conductance mechanosensitive channel|nr:mechanosensitive ion channel family protein [Clostridiales bacterium]